MVDEYKHNLESNNIEKISPEFAKTCNFFKFSQFLLTKMKLT